MPSMTLPSGPECFPDLPVCQDVPKVTSVVSSRIMRDSIVYCHKNVPFEGARNFAEEGEMSLSPYHPHSKRGFQNSAPWIPPDFHFIYEKGIIPETLPASWGYCEEQMGRRIWKKFQKKQGNTSIKYPYFLFRKMGSVVCRWILIMQWLKHKPFLTLSSSYKI